MAYLTCPWCLTPQQIDDDSPGYQCFTCYGQIRFFQCPDCTLVQTVSQTWTAFTCGGCERKVDLPRRWGYSRSARAVLVQGTGKSYPRL
ncbi:MAG: hypothetical protein ACRDHU_01605 [Actinomycetota bacterium]|jgi:hypothetical protein